MHKSVCIWQYILQNYNYKLHFQNLSIYHIPHVFIGTLIAENFDVCTACDPWDSNIQLTMVKDRRWQIYPQCHSNRKLTTILISKSWGWPPPGPGMPFLDSDTCAGEGYLFLSGFSSLYDVIHGWMMGWMDRWMKKASWKTTTTSFTICNKALGEITYVHLDGLRHHFFGCENLSKCEMFKIKSICSHNILSLSGNNHQTSKKKIVKFSPILDSDFSLVALWKIIFLLFG